MAASVSAPSIRRGPARVSDAAALARRLNAGDRIYMPGSAAEIPAFVAALCDGTAPPVAITSSFIPGINPPPVDNLPEGASYASMFAHPVARGAQAAGKFRHLPLGYSGFSAHLLTAEFDVCLVQVTPPDDKGQCSLGAAVEFTPRAMQRAKKLFAVINTQMPRMPGAPTIAVDRFDAFAKCDFPLRAYDVGAPSAQAQAIAGHVAPFVRDGSTLQVGLGKAPDALARLIADRNNLRLHSGMLSDGARLLAERGCLDPAYRHMSCVHVGTGDYYRWLDSNELFAVRGCEETHDAATLMQLRDFVAVNGAISVDLFGQANLEMLDGRMLSAVGGAADFARAAALSPDGVSIIALPSVGGRDMVSRIVPKLDGPASLPRQDIEIVVTEHGAADLRGLTVIERAQALIAIADPRHQPALSAAWRDIAAKF